MSASDIEGIAWKFLYEAVSMANAPFSNIIATSSVLIQCNIFVAVNTRRLLLSVVASLHSEKWRLAGEACFEGFWTQSDLQSVDRKRCQLWNTTDLNRS